MKTFLHTAASLLLKVGYDDGTSKTIGYCRNLTYTVQQGQKMIMTVDSPLPAEIAQGAAPQFVKGSVTLYLPKGNNPESLGLASYRIDTDGSYIATQSKYMSWQIMDRATLNLIMACEFCKVSSYTVTASARGIVELNLQFDGFQVTPGLTL